MNCFRIKSGNGSKGDKFMYLCTKNGYSDASAAKSFQHFTKRFFMAVF